MINCKFIVYNTIYALDFILYYVIIIVTFRKERRLLMGRTLGKESNHSFEDYFKRATSPMLTLFLLNEKPMYVYKLSQELEKRSNKIYKMNFLYPVLYRLQEQGYVVEYSQEITESHRTRNYYAITDEGKQYLKKMIEQYKGLLSAVDVIMNNETNKEALENENV